MRLENTARPAAVTLCLHRDQNPNLRSPTVSGNLQRETLCRSVGRMMCFHCETAPALNYSVKAQPRKPQKPGKRRTASASLAHSEPHLGSAVRSSLLGGVTKTCTISFSGEDINCSWYFLGKQRSTYRGGGGGGVGLFLRARWCTAIKGLLLSRSELTTEQQGRINSERFCLFSARKTCTDRAKVTHAFCKAAMTMHRHTHTRTHIWAQ